MDLPIVIVEGHDVYVFPTQDYLAKDLEPWYVDQSEYYDAFDSKGYLLELFLEEVEYQRKFLSIKQTSLRKLVRARKIMPPINRSDQLRSSLVDYIKHMKKNVLTIAELNKKTVGELIEECLRYM